jgi:hypothetical protein
MENKLLIFNWGTSQKLPNRHSRESGNLAHNGKDSCFRRNDDLLLNSKLLRQPDNIINCHYDHPERSRRKVVDNKLVETGL